MASRGGDRRNRVRRCRFQDGSRSGVLIRLRRLAQTGGGLSPLREGGLRPLPVSVQHGSVTLGGGSDETCLREASGLCLLAVASFALITTFASPAIAAGGDLDPKFGGDGRVTTNVTSGYDRANDVAIQADGRIVVAGVADERFALVRYDRDGTVDRTFGRAGTVRTVVGQARGYGDVSALAIQSNGKIVAVGSTYYWRTDTRLAMVRYLPNGALDPTFSGNGKVVAAFMGGASDLAIQADGKIVVVGTSGTSFIVARYRHDGSLDPTFGTGGKVMTSVSDVSAADAAVAIQPDGKIVVAGDESFFVGGAGWEDAVVVRYQPGRPGSAANGRVVSA
jgi:uncharacterized delta-60 repeat protein